MAKIYDKDGKKLNTVEILSGIRGMLSEHRARILGAGYIEIENPRLALAVMILDAYKYLPSGAEEDGSFRKYCLNYVNKYMK